VASGRSSAEAQKFLVAHFAEARSHLFELVWLESYGGISDNFHSGHWAHYLGRI
jgi:hypothetical protein